jgi:pimeloyl-ACP methyl ester carboxylesterase
MPITEINNVKINHMQLAYKGTGVAEDLVMVHGLAANMAFWMLDYAKYFSEFYRVTLYDLRGHGRSSVTENGYASYDMANDLGILLDTINIPKAHIMAHSFGGAVAINFACSNPARVASLVIADTHISSCRKNGGVNNPVLQSSLQQCGINLDVNDPYFGYKLLTEVARLRVADKQISKESFPWAEWIFGGNNKRSAESWLYLMDKTTAGAEFVSDDKLTTESLKKIICPSLLMYGDKSQAITSGNYLSDLWPHAEFVAIKNAGHFFPRVYPDLVKSHCDTFYSTVKVEALQ